jgi:FkbM family methyltransferase
MLDIGGWIGTTCLYCSDKFKEVYVFECDPKALKRLKLNIEANPSMTNIKLIEKAISSKVGKVNFFSNVDGGESSLVLDAKGMGEEIQIDTTTFDVFVKNSKINPTEIGFIKMDIEGAEAEVIPDMKEWLEKHKPVLHLSLHRDLNTIQEIENILDILCGIYPICLQFGIRGNSKKVEKNWILNNLEMSTNEYVFCIN